MAAWVVRDIIASELLEIDATWTSIVISSYLFVTRQDLLLVATSIQEGICIVILVKEGATSYWDRKVLVTNIVRRYTLVLL